MNKIHWNRLTTTNELLPDQQWVSVTKHRLLAEIGRRQRQRDAARFSFADSFRYNLLRVSRKFMPRYQVVIASFMILSLSVSTAVMARAAMPGDALWPMKLTMEKAEVAFASNSERESRVHMKHVDNRLHELAVIAKQPKRSKTITQVVRRLEQDMTLASQSMKIAQEERQDSEPQIIMALAKDLNDKTNAAQIMLAENKQTLNSESGTTVIDSVIGIVMSTSTEPVITDDIDAKVSTSTSVTSTEPVIVQQTEKARTEQDIARSITDVQIVNQYISYNAVGTMVDVMERSGEMRQRSYVEGLLRERLAEQQRQAKALREALPLITDDFQLHRAQVLKLVNQADEMLARVEGLVYIGYLKEALGKLNQAKDVITATAKLLQEVSDNNGLVMKREAQAIAPAKGTTTVTIPVSIQSVPVTMQSIGNDDAGLNSQ